MSLKPAPRILVAGVGCTGALTAALIRRNAEQRALHLSVWEWARGPAGRMTSFWSNVGPDLSDKCLADVGAQVISVRTAERLPSWLQPHLMPAHDAGLARTEERAGDWEHYFAPEGLPALQRYSLDQAEADELHFNRRLVELSMIPGKAGVSKWRASYSGENGGRRPVGHEDFDVVVFAGTSADAVNLQGLTSGLSHPHLQQLRSVRYDHRLCVALILKPEMANIIEKCCQGRAELSCSSNGQGVISLLARQDIKGRSCQGACSVVLHSTTNFARENLQAAKTQNCSPSDLGKRQLMSSLASLLGMPGPSLEAHVLDSKTVHWRQCQVQRSSLRQQAAGNCISSSHLILAGDYLASAELAGSFDGCLESAEAAAQEACSLVFANGSSEASMRKAEDQRIRPDAGPEGGGRWRSAVSSSSAKEQSASVGNSSRPNRSRRWQAKAES